MKLSSHLREFSLALVILSALTLRTIPDAVARYQSAYIVRTNPLGTVELVAPSQLSAKWQGTNVWLTWKPGMNGSGYAIAGALSNTSNCAAVTWTPIAQVQGMSVTNFLDLRRDVPPHMWYCYTVRTILGDWITTQNPTAAIQESARAPATPTAGSPATFSLARPLSLATATQMSTATQTPTPIVQKPGTRTPVASPTTFPTNVGTHATLGSQISNRP